jgi:hypothetical protein
MSFRAPQDRGANDERRAATADEATSRAPGPDSTLGTGSVLGIGCVVAVAIVVAVALVLLWLLGAW